MIDVGKSIRRHRKRKHMTQDALAERLHVTRQAVSNWETGKNLPDLDTLEAAAAALDLELADLLREGGGEYPRFQKKAVGWAVLLGLLTLLLLGDELFIAPRLLELKGRTYDPRPYAFNSRAVLPCLRLAAGMLVPAAVSLRYRVQPEGAVKTGLRIASVLLSVPVILTALTLTPAGSAALSRIMTFLLSDPTGFRQNIICRVCPFLAGLCLYPAFVQLQGQSPGQGS